MTRTEYRKTTMAEHLATVGAAAAELAVQLRIAAHAAHTFLPDGQLVSYRDPAAVSEDAVLARVTRRHPDGTFVVTTLRTGRERTFRFDPGQLEIWSFRLVDEDDRDE